MASVLTAQVLYLCLACGKLHLPHDGKIKLTVEDGQDPHAVVMSAVIDIHAPVREHDARGFKTWITHVCGITGDVLIDQSSRALGSQLGIARFAGLRIIDHGN